MIPAQILVMGAEMGARAVDSGQRICRRVWGNVICCKLVGTTELTSHEKQIGHNQKPFSHRLGQICGCESIVLCLISVTIKRIIIEPDLEISSWTFIFTEQRNVVRAADRLI
jgi:hypothetical protein